MVRRGGVGALCWTIERLTSNAGQRIDHCALSLVMFPMSPSRRIFLNSVATYGRSLHALVCGLFISQCMVAALGKTGFCLFDVTVGMTVVVLVAFTMRLERGRCAAGEVFGCIPHGARAWRDV